MSADTDTWMPLYVADYLKDTRHLSTIEHGAYFMLILHAWTHDGALPRDPVRLARIAGMSAKEWKESGPVLLEFFNASGGGYRHKRIDAELARASSVVEQRRAAGRASAEARKAKRNGNDEPTDVATNVSTGSQRNGRPSQSHSSDTSVSDAAASKLDLGDEPEIDPIKLMFDQGVELLTSHGTASGPARSLIGKWRKEHGDAEVMLAITAARREQPSEPRAWITGRLESRGKPNGGYVDPNKAFMDHMRRKMALEERQGETR